ncbi:GPO family capsid scaffolding protein [Providencia hangzhouensis]
MAEVVSDWLCICAAGSAIDGRKVDDAWLKQVADNYDREKYTAMIWPQHHDDIEWRQWSYNFGSVDSLKYEVENGIGKLYARLVPNEFLLNTNREKQKLFTSAEFWPDFANTGEWYLSGLAVTDVPASLYTDKLQFSATNKSDSILRSEPLTFSLGQVSPRKSSLINRLFSFTPKTPEKTDDKKSTQESEPMNEELKALLTELLAKVSTIEEKSEGEGVDTPEEAAEEIAELAEEIAEAVEDVQEIAAEMAENPEDEVLETEFSVANKHFEKLVLTYSAKISGKKGLAVGVVPC